MDFTVKFWPLMGNVGLLISVGTFLVKVYRKISLAVDAVREVLSEHHEMYAWYRKQNGKPNGGALGIRL